jgi:hypothetical protein
MKKPKVAFRNFARAPKSDSGSDTYCWSAVNGNSWSFVRIMMCVGVRKVVRFCKT